MKREQGVCQRGLRLRARCGSFFAALTPTPDTRGHRRPRWRGITTVLGAAHRNSAVMGISPRPARGPKSGTTPGRGPSRGQRPRSSGPRPVETGVAVAGDERGASIAARDGGAQPRPRRGPRVAGEAAQPRRGHIAGEADPSRSGRVRSHSLSCYVQVYTVCTQGSVIWNCQPTSVEISHPRNSRWPPAAPRRSLEGTRRGWTP